MTTTDIISLQAFCGTVLTGVFTLVVTVTQTKTKAETTSEHLARLDRALESLQLDVNEHSVKSSRLEQTSEKQVNRLENTIRR